VRGRTPGVGSWREAIACDGCRAMQRSVLLAERLIATDPMAGSRSLRAAARSMRHLRIHELGSSGSVHDQLRRLPGFSWSELFDGVEPGSLGPGGVRCEDVERLTFDDATFDLIISQDVFEHVPDPDVGFREVHRVLRPGGRHVFTVPYDPALPASRTRARRATDGTIEHVLPPAYHLDPIRATGALVFTDFGPDLPERLRAAGFDVRLFERRRPDLPGGYTVAFETVRVGRT
jgi:SAM-dependent methyltransferase